MDFDGKTISSALLEYTGDVAARAMRTDFDLLAQIARTLIEAKERGATIYTAGQRRQRGDRLAHLQRPAQGLPRPQPRGLQDRVPRGFLRGHDLSGQRLLL